jgi:methionyl-tRNA synthetase
VTTLVETLEAISVMIAPVMPTVSARVRTQLGLAPLTTAIGEDRWPFDLPTRPAGGAIPGGDPIFPRLDKDKHADLVARFSPPAPADEAKPKAEAASAPEAAKPEAKAAKATIAYDDFAKLDLRVGLVISAERVKKKDKLLDLRVDTGDAAPRRIVSGIAMAYTPEELVGQRIVVVCNLAPRDFGKGLVSEGMLLTGDGPAGLKLLSIDPSAPPGTPVA